MGAPSYGATRRLGQAKAHEFSINQGFKNGYRNREDLTTLPPGILIPGSQNVLTNTNGRVAIRGGYTLDGQANTDLAPIASSFDFISAGGIERHLRTGFLTSAGNDGKMQFRNEHSDGTIVWEDLLTNLTNVDFNYALFWNPALLQTQVLMVNGTNNLYVWGGASANLLSAANPTGIIGTIELTPNLIADAGGREGSGGVDYVVGDVLTITGGSGTAKITVQEVKPGAVKTGSINAPGVGYATNDLIGIQDAGGTAAVLTVTSTGGGGSVTGFSILKNGIDYTNGLTGLTSTTTGGGTGFTFDVSTTGNGITSWSFVSDADHGTGYVQSPANSPSPTTGGAGTNARVGIETVTSGSITKTGTQTWVQAGFYTGTGSNLQITINGTVYSYDHFNDVLGDTTTLYGVTPDPSGEAPGSLILQTPLTIPLTTIGFTSFITPNLIGVIDQRVFLAVAAKAGAVLARGSVFISKVNDYTSWAGGTTSGNVGDPFEVDLNSAPTAFIPQEQQMYVSAGHDEWYLIEFTLSADLQKESVSINRLNTTAQQAAQSQAATSKIANSIVFLSFEPNIRSFGRIPNILANNAPQMSDLSYTIINDMNQYDFTNAALFYYRKFVYVAIPAEGLVLAYNMTDEQHPYWEAPQVLPISRFSIIDGQLYGHSSEVSETYKLFTGTNDHVTPTSTGFPIEAVWRFSYEQFGSRFSLKKATKAYVEGYISEGAELIHTLSYELDGCKTVKTFTLDGSDNQFVCITEPSGPLGKQSLGKVKLGGDNFDSLNNLPPKFHWFPTFSNTDFYELSPSFSSREPNAQIELLAFGLAAGPSSEIPVKNMD